MTNPTMVIYHYRERFPTDEQGQAEQERLQAQHPDVIVRVVAGYERIIVREAGQP